MFHATERPRQYSASVRGPILRKSHESGTERTSSLYHPLFRWKMKHSSDGLDPVSLLMLRRLKLTSDRKLSNRLMSRYDLPRTTSRGEYLTFRSQQRMSMMLW